MCTYVEPHLRGLKACWTVLWNDWQLTRLGKIPQVLLPDIHEWSDHPQVLLPDGRARNEPQHERLFMYSYRCQGKKYGVKVWCNLNNTRHVLDGVVSLHCAQSTVVEDRHHEALGQVIQVLPECQHVAAVPPCCRVQPPSLHAGTEATDGVQVWLFGCLAQDVWSSAKSHKQNYINNRP